jgi:hypothetical protein
MLGMNGIGSLPDLGQAGSLRLTALIAGLGIAFLLPRSEDLVRRFHPLVMLGAFALFFIAVCQLLATNHVPFLYFRF